MNKKQREEAAAHAALQETAKELGREYFKKDPEALLALVSRMGSALSQDKEIISAYIEGYVAARNQKEEYSNEKAKGG